MVLQVDSVPAREAAELEARLQDYWNKVPEHELPVTVANWEINQPRFFGEAKRLPAPWLRMIAKSSRKLYYTDVTSMRSTYDLTVVFGAANEGATPSVADPVKPLPLAHRRAPKSCTSAALPGLASGAQGMAVYGKRCAKAQRRYPIREVWGSSQRLPKKLTEYISAACQEFSAPIRQEAILLLKRYVYHQAEIPVAKPRNLQVVALTCANLAAKYWQQRGIPEQQLHWLSCNAFTREDFVAAEVDVLRVLDYNVHWDGALFAEWVPLLLFFCEDLLKEASDMAIIMAVASHVIDILAFQDELMSAYWPSELAAGTIQATIFLCTKSFKGYTFCRRVNHLCRAQDCEISALSEKILQAAVGKKGAELIIDGGGSCDPEPLSALPPGESDSEKL
ncbi:unnamed protein product [Symbiodinium sp. CCMP2456]|nr:unnamed protein product [Symbiodinium sp. CCMP2456]